MPKPIEKLLLAVTDLITINLAFFALVHLRSQLNLFVASEFTMLLRISMLIYVVWALLFVFLGVYQSWYTKSRFDELITVFKSVAFGIVLIFVATFEPEQDLTHPPTFGRMMILSYFALMIVFVGGGRLVLHTIQRKLLQAGIGARNTVIVGWNTSARKLGEKIKKYPALGYRLLGFISLDSDRDKKSDERVLASLDQLPGLVPSKKIEHVILSPGKMAHKKVLNIIAQVQDLPVQIKIEPDMYDIVMGQARTQQIYGFPLIDIQPQLMPPWEKRTKRLLDTTFSLLMLAIMSPILLLTALLIKIDSSGPVFFKQKRVGKDGHIFTIYKFRTMVKNAEKLTGPVWAGQKDPRITRVGRMLRKTRLDEFPQLLNVLYGDMSLVGPRPERPYFVDKLKREYPFYTRRLKVKPGITGWAQVKGEYDTTIENVKEKLDYDLYYIENMSLRMDFRILLFTISVMLRFKGQ